MILRWGVYLQHYLGAKLYHFLPYSLYCGDPELPGKTLLVFPADFALRLQDDKKHTYSVT